MLLITWKIFPCKLRRRSRTIAKYAPTLTVSGNIAREEFFQCCISYFFQYSGNFPVILTEGCNVSSRRRSRFFPRARGKRRLRRRRPGGFPSADINPDVLNSSVGGSDPSFSIAEPQLLAPTSHLAAMTPSRATEPPNSVQTTVGAYTLLQ
jgi:hypothetical protein